MYYKISPQKSTKSYAPHFPSVTVRIGVSRKSKINLECIKGVAILGHGAMKQYIRNISHIDHRIMKLTPASPRAPISITILTTYAPHKGYKREIRNNHWSQVEQTFANIPKTHLCIWRADANVQLGHRARHITALMKIIGTHTNAVKTERGNGKSLQRICISHEMAPMNTWRRNPGQTTHDTINATTWKSPDDRTHTGKLIT